MDKEIWADSAHLMRHPRAVCRPSNTGEKYIGCRRKKSGNPFYRVVIKRLGINKQFARLEDAIQFRNGVISDG